MDTNTLTGFWLIKNKRSNHYLTANGSWVRPEWSAKIFTLWVEVVKTLNSLDNDCTVVFIKCGDRAELDIG